ncbi:hypothetical protein LZZ85_00310 [Terrimonas sp. NA20]|uniref:DUF2934 domain-containing protein n=1 Tax=Terrimonas ginsenosidimutans TaxID=2908004 RepID=A0ABS9KK45_9BACT|nr:hypothetical protein [Terrimonas ginsenosidimutans]MCG2612692.1 hypothetical protein [Terrimonas ginsenosidimutans]
MQQSNDNSKDVSKDPDSLYSMWDKGGYDEKDLKYWIGNTDRSDLEFYKQSKEAEQIKEKLDSAATADSLLDAVETTLKGSREKSDQQDAVSEYIDRTTPSHDYWEEVKRGGIKEEEVRPEEGLEESAEIKDEDPDQPEVKEPVAEITDEHNEVEETSDVDDDMDGIEVVSEEMEQEMEEDDDEVCL